MIRKQTNLHDLPRFSDKLSYLYIEHAIVEQQDTAIAAHKADGKTVSVPAAALAVLMLGPGTTLTHAAVKTLAESNCQVIWLGEHGVRFYAQGLGGARSSKNLLKQAYLSTHETERLKVVVRMYCMRFEEEVEEGLTLQQLRGKEGVRVRQSYADAAKKFGVSWQGRNYKRQKWSHADPINRALSAANSCLYGLCHAAIISGGYSPALGFIHTGKQLSFVYDIADLYKAKFSIPIAFSEVHEGYQEIESRVRRVCRDRFRSEKLVEQILPDITTVLDINESNIEPSDAEDSGNEDASLPHDWWQPTKLASELPIGAILNTATDRPWKENAG